MAIEGVQPEPKMRDLYRVLSDPADMALDLIHNISFGVQSPLSSTDGSRVSMSAELWRITSFFRLHLSMALSDHHSDVFEWYYNPEEAVTRDNECASAHFAAELFLHLRVGHCHDGTRILTPISK